MTHDNNATNNATDTSELGRVAIAHLGVGLVLVSVFTWIEPVAQPRHTGLAGIPMLIASVVVGIAALRASTSRRVVVRSLYGLLAFGSAAFLGAATGIWANNSGAHFQLTAVI